MVPGVSKVDMLVATTRRPAATPGEVYSGDRTPDLTFTNVVVSIPPDADAQAWRRAMAVRRAGKPGDGFCHRERRAARSPPAPANGSTRRGRALHSRRVLIFVHGFNNRFDDAVYRFAQVVHDSDASVRPILFTWPSRGSVFAYGYDRESAMFSRDALERTLDLLIADRASARSTFSPIPWATCWCWRRCGRWGSAMAACRRRSTTSCWPRPDVDVDVFASQIRDMGMPRTRISRCSSRATTKRWRCRDGCGAAMRAWARSTPTPSPTRARSPRAASASSTSRSKNRRTASITANSPTAPRS